MTSYPESFPVSRLFCVLFRANKDGATLRFHRVYVKAHKRMNAIRRARSRIGKDAYGVFEVRDWRDIPSGSIRIGM